MNRKMMIPALLMGIAVLTAAPNMSAQAAEADYDLGNGSSALQETFDLGKTSTFTPKTSYYYEFAGTSDSDTYIYIKDASGNDIEWSADSYDAGGNCLNDDFDTVVWMEAGTTYTVEIGDENYDYSAADAENESIPTLQLTVKKAKVKLKSISSNSTKGGVITWEALNTTSEPCYAVFRKNPSSGGWSKIGTTYDTTYTDKTAATGISYLYTVRACMYTDPTNIFGSDYESAGLQFLAGIKTLTFANTSNGMSVKWTKVTGATGYNVYRKGTSGGFSKIAVIKSGSTVSYIDTAVASKNGTTYTYAVRAFNATDLGGYNGVTTIRMTPPTLSSLTNTKTRKLTVKWAKNTYATGYVLQYATNSSFSDVKTVYLKSSSYTSKVLTGLTKNKTYYVRIRSYRISGSISSYSEWSSAKTIKITK